MWDQKECNTTGLIFFCNDNFTVGYAAGRASWGNQSPLCNIVGPYAAARSKRYFTKGIHDIEVYPLERWLLTAMDMSTSQTLDHLALDLVVIILIVGPISIHTVCASSIGCIGMLVHFTKCKE